MMLKVDVEKLLDTAVLYFQGHILVGAGTATLREAVFSHPDARILILDFSRVDLIDAAGLGTLVELRAWTQIRGIKLRLENPTRRVQDLFALTCLDSVLDISFPDDLLSKAATNQTQSNKTRSRPADRVARRVGLPGTAKRLNLRPR